MFQKIIIKNLLFNEEYIREVSPFLKKEYFTSPYQELYSTIEQFFSKFNERPSLDVIEIRIGMLQQKLPERIFKELVGFYEELKKYSSAEQPNLEWLIQETEKFCRDSAIENALRKSIKIINGEDKQQSKDAIPELLKEAVSITFDRSVGHDYFEDAEKRYDYYTRIEEKIPFDIDFLNKITNGGITRKTLNIFVGGVNVGKTLTLCHFASHYLKSFYNVLYITMEMSEEEIVKRIDANLLDISIDYLKNLNKNDYLERVERLRKTVPKGKLIVKEYPTAVPNINHFRKLLLELKTKKDFVPDVVIIDYMNICSSARIVNDGKNNTYVIVKAIAEELRGFAMENRVPVITATQLNRTGFSASDVDMTAISDSFGTAMTADLIVTLINNETLESSNVIIMKQLKNRYGDATKYKKSYVGIDRTRMRLYNVENDKIDIDQSLADGIDMEDLNFDNLSKLSSLF